MSDDGPAILAPGDSFGSLLGQVKQALAAWDSVSSPNLRVKFGGLESDGQISAAPGGDVVFQDLPPGLYGMGGPTSNGTTIVRGTVILGNNTNPGYGAGPSYLENFFTTAVHEVGHALGLQHTWTGSAMSQDVLRNTSRARPFDADDVAAINVLYGPAGWQNNFGTITGTVRFANGTAGHAGFGGGAEPDRRGGEQPDQSGRHLPDQWRSRGQLPAVRASAAARCGACRRHGAALAARSERRNVPALRSLRHGVLPQHARPEPGDTVHRDRGQHHNRTTPNFTVQTRTSVPAYDLVTSSYLDPRTMLPLYDTSTVAAPIQVSPAIVNNTLSSLFVKVEANSGDTPVPQSGTILGGFGVASGTYLRTYTDDRTGRRALAMYWGMPPFANTGPRHLVLNYGSDIYVLPQAINLVKRPAPVISAARPNADGSVSVTGSNFGADSVVYFDGIQAVRPSAFVGNDVQGSLSVLPPAGTGGQVSQVIVYNGDSQNSTFGASNNPQTYSYPNGGTPQMQALSLTSLPAGATGMVDITTQNTAFADGQVTIGFGNDDITVQRVWVLSPNHLQANITVAANAITGSSEFSVISGFEVLAQPNAFQVQPRNPGLPVIGSVGNATTTQQTIYPGVFAAIYGVNLANSPSSVQVTLGGQAVTLQPGGVSSGQINFLIPANFPTGAAILQLNNGGVAANPIVVQIDVPPPTIQSVTNASGVPYDANHAASSQDVVNINVSNLDPTVVLNPSRLQVTLNGQAVPVQGLAPAGNGQTQITFVLTQGFGGAVVNLAVVVDGSSSVPYPITVR